MAYDIFLKIDGIEGEAQDSKHKNELQIESCSVGAEVGVVRSPGTAGVVHDATFTAVASKAGPKLAQACASGTSINSVVLTFRKSGGTQVEFLVVTFSSVLISSYSLGGKSKSNNQIPTERFTLNFAKIAYDYRAQKPDGGLSGAIKTSYAVQSETGQGQ